MTDEITRKLRPINRHVRVEELEAYVALQIMAERAGVLGYDIQSALRELVRRAGEIKIRVEAA